MRGDFEYFMEALMVDWWKFCSHETPDSYQEWSKKY